MSFRSRTRTVQPVTARRRASSLTRSSNGTSLLGASNGLQNGISSYTPSTSYISRPSSLQYSGYQSNYGNSNSYGSKENLYSPSSRTSSSGSGNYFDYSSNKRRDSYGSTTSLNSMKYANANNNSYSSPYKDYDRYGSNNSSSSYSSPYKDRYVSPYTNYDNGVTTAGLNFSYNNGSGSGASSKYSSSPYSSSSMASRISTNGINGGSNSSLNSYHPVINSSAKVGRSQSMRDQERKSRSRSRSAAVSQATRSLSVSSLASEGYESGTEQPSSRSRVSSTHSLSNDVDSSENCELIDYKALYEAAKADNDKLKITLRKKDEDLVSVKGALDRFTNATTKNSLSELEKREKRAMERKISEMEEELKQLDALKTENQRLKDENGALIRVISKLSK